jgi:hypothetical protein
LPNARFVTSVDVDLLLLKLFHAYQRSEHETVQIRARQAALFCTMPEILTNPLIFAIAAG